MHTFGHLFAKNEFTTENIFRTDKYDALFSVPQCEKHPTHHKYIPFSNMKT